MFSMQEIGARISTLRKQQNMTQMELADRLGISFQAVSNWERGNTMPDIAKLPELAELFGVSIDELFGKPAPILHAALNNTLAEYVQEAKPALEELAETAPILKPEQIGEAFENMSIEEDEDSVSPDEDHVPPDEDDEEALSSLAPFLPTAVLDELAEKRIAAGKPMSSLIPFISSAACEKLARMTYQRDGIDGLQNSGLIPFLPENALEEIAQVELEQHGIKGISPFAPFLCTAYLDKLAQQIIVRDGLSAILPIVPFLSSDFLSQYAKQRWK